MGDEGGVCVGVLRGGGVGGVRVGVLKWGVGGGVERRNDYMFLAINLVLFVQFPLVYINTFF